MGKQEEIREFIALELQYMMSPHIREFQDESGKDCRMRHAQMIMEKLHSQGVVIQHPAAILTWETEPLIPKEPSPKTNYDIHTDPAD